MTSSEYLCSWADIFGGGLRIVCKPGHRIQRIAQEVLADSTTLNFALLVSHMSQVCDALRTEPIAVGNPLVAQHPLTQVLVELMSTMSGVRVPGTQEATKRAVAELAAGRETIFIVFLQPMAPFVGWTLDDRKTYEHQLLAWWDPGARSVAQTRKPG